MKLQQPSGSDQVSDPSQWVDRHGDYLFRYALLRLRNRELAEEMVQETFLAALTARENFAGRSAERSWLVGILKHKIVDHFRRQQRERPASEIDNSPEWLDSLFDAKGWWREGPREWSAEPSKTLEQKEFWEVFFRCLSGLPTRQADAFSLRELEHLETDQICKVLQVSATNLWVVLHRARMRLWRCLDSNWFAGQAERV